MNYRHWTAPVFAGIGDGSSTAIIGEHTYSNPKWRKTEIEV
jgi:hypothetical protein